MSPSIVGRGKRSGRTCGCGSPRVWTGRHSGLEGMRRGDLITVALPGDFGKPRPALVIQSDLFNETHPTVTVLPLTSDLRNAPLFRVLVEPSPENGLEKVSQIMIDKPITFLRTKIG